MERNGGENGRRMNLEAASIISVAGYYQDADESSFRSWSGWLDWQERDIFKSSTYSVICGAWSSLVVDE